MLRKRLIFTLIFADGFFMQSRNFRLQKVGDIEWVEKNYNFEKIAFSLDEIVVLDASNNKNISVFSGVINRLAEDVFIPISAGGGINSVADADMLFGSGADKVVLNTSIYKDPELVNNLVNKYGSQSVIASVDYKNNNVFICDGRVKLSVELNDYIKYIESLKIGEIYLNSIDRDGTGFGFDLDTVVKVSGLTSTSIIIAGGAGNKDHLMEGLSIKNINAVATANLFNFIGDGLPHARHEILQDGFNIAQWMAK
jgi:cyclase